MATIDSPAEVPVNSVLLRDARARLRLNPTDAAELVTKELVALRADASGVSNTTILEWESGAPVSFVQAEALARTYLISFPSLFGHQLESDRILDFRLGADATVTGLSYDARKQLARFGSFYELARRLADELGAYERIGVPKEVETLARVPNPVEVIGARLRSALGITYREQIDWDTDEAALAGWRDRMEALGVFVFSLPLPVEECRGASRWDLDGPPAILLNTADSTAAQIFTLVHEFAHLALTDTDGNVGVCNPALQGVKDRERLANRVAAAAILPEGLLIRNLPVRPDGASYSQWPQATRQRLRALVNVSHGVIGIRLEHLGVVSSAGSLRSFWRSAGPARRGTSDSVSRSLGFCRGQAVASARQAIERELISTTEISRALDLKVSDVEAVVGM